MNGHIEWKFLKQTNEWASEKKREEEEAAMNNEIKNLLSQLSLFLYSFHFDDFIPGSDGASQKLRSSSCTLSP